MKLYDSNPMGRVPVLERDDGSKIAESIAIRRWHEEVSTRPSARA